RCRRHKSHRPNHGPRMWADVKLFADHEIACRSCSKFQAPQIGVGTNRVVNSCPFVSIRGWLDGRIKRRKFWRDSIAETPAAVIARDVNFLCGCICGVARGADFPQSRPRSETE